MYIVQPSISLLYPKESSTSNFKTARKKKFFQWSNFQLIPMCYYVNKIILFQSVTKSFCFNFKRGWRGTGGVFGGRVQKQQNKQQKLQSNQCKYEIAQPYWFSLSFNLNNTKPISCFHVPPRKQISPRVDFLSK